MIRTDDRFTKKRENAEQYTVNSKTQKPFLYFLEC